MPSFASRRQNILDQIAQAAKQAGRNAQDIKLIAACKTQNNQVMETAFKAGQYIFGENRLQEGQYHFSQIDPETRAKLELHFIGPLQSNKALDAVKLFDYIQSLDRISLAKALAEAVQKTGISPKFLVQINIGDEPQKSGVLLKDLHNFMKDLERNFQIKPQGFMVIPPVDLPAAPFFALTHKFAKDFGLKELSMGMSDDFQAAIKFGATFVRIGTALFGNRL